jgi:hypothetical protein
MLGLTSANLPDEEGTMDGPAERPDYPTTEMMTKADAQAEPLVDRVERLERALLEVGERLSTHGESLGRIGARLDRAEKHVGL